MALEGKWVGVSFVKTVIIKVGVVTHHFNGLVALKRLLQIKLLYVNLFAHQGVPKTKNFRSQQNFFVTSLC